MKHLIVSCVKSKNKRLDGPELKHCSGNLRVKYNEWSEKIDQAEKHPVNNVYQQAMWSASKEAYDELRKFNDETTMWVVSAGLGLINIEDEIPKYDATFNKESENSISVGFDRPSAEVNQQWWDMLTKSNLTGGCRSISELINNNQNDEYFMAMAGTYYQAIHNDLEGIKNLPSELICVGIKAGNEDILPPRLQQQIIPYSNGEKLRKAIQDQNDGCNKNQLHPKTIKLLNKRYRQKDDFDLTLDGLEPA